MPTADIPREAVEAAIKKQREVNVAVMRFLLRQQDRSALLLADQVHRTDDELRDAIAAAIRAVDTPEREKGNG